MTNQLINGQVAVPGDAELRDYDVEIRREGDGCTVTGAIHRPAGDIDIGPLFYAAAWQQDLRAVARDAARNQAVLWGAGHAYPAQSGAAARRP